MFQLSAVRGGQFSLALLLRHSRCALGAGRNACTPTASCAIRTMASAAAARFPPCEISRSGPRLVLFFDVNKTVIMSDPVQGKGPCEVLNDVIAEAAWGRTYTDDSGALQWRDANVALSVEPPGDDPSLVSFAAFTRVLYPKPAMGPELSRDKRIDLMKSVREHRSKLTSTFTNDGCTGSRYKGIFDELASQLEYNGTVDVIIPSFFRLLLSLHASEREFTIVFRTFGDDIDRIRADLDRFCEGKHPRFPSTSFDGSHGRQDFRISEEGSFFRSGASSDDAVLIRGKAVAQRATIQETIEAVEQQIGRNAPMVRGFHELQRFFESGLTARAVTAYRDHFACWSANKELAPYAKIGFADKSGRENTLLLFFDDNFKVKEILDLRSRDTFEPLPVDVTDGTFAVKVEPLHALHDPWYFIREISKCEESYAKLAE